MRESGRAREGAREGGREGGGGGGGGGVGGPGEREIQRETAES
jgi:hypothetical protein